MRHWATLLYCFVFLANLNSFAIQATCNSYLFYKNNNKDNTQLEANIVLSWRAQNKSLHFKKNDQGGYFAEINCIVRISNDTTIIKEEEFVIKTAPKNNTEELDHQLIADQYSYPITEKGDWEIEFVLFEKDYKNEVFEFKKSHDLTISISNQHLLSDIVLLDTFFYSNISTAFSRHGFIDIPSCSNFLNESKDSAHFIFELYPKFLSSNKSLKRTLIIQSFLSYKKSESPIPDKNITDTITANDELILPFRKSFDIADIKSGNYYLNVICVENEQEICRQSLFFQVYNPNYIAKAPSIKQDTASEKDSNSSEKNSHILDLTNTFVGKYDATQVRAILKMLLLICDPNEALSINSFLQKPDELYSKYFIYNFWEKRDKQNPAKAWLAYAEKIKEVNRLFKGSGMSGFETDRGKVYIQYGKPNDRIIVNNESGALPYEIWQYYNTEKQRMEGVFLFYKPGRALGDYQLLHSTLRGERRNANWRSLLYNNSITGGGIINSNSQAEQYIGNK